MIDPLYKRPLKFKMNAVLLASGLSVGLTKCYFLPGHPGWSGYLTCFIVGYFASVTVALLAGALSKSSKPERNTKSIAHLMDRTGERCGRH